MKKRIISFALAVMMILTVLPASASDGSEPALKAIYSWSEDLCDSIDLSVYDYVELSFRLDKGDSDSETVSPDKLTFPDFITYKGMSGNGMCVIYAAHTGTGSITYTEGDVTCSLPVTVRLPELGIYTSTDFIEENLAEEFSLTNSNTVFYIALSPEIVEQGYQMTDVADELDETMTSITTVADVTISDDGSYVVVKVTNPDADGSYHILVTASLPGGDSVTYGRGLTIVNRKPQLMVIYPEWDNSQGKWAVPDDCRFAFSPFSFPSDGRYQFIFCYGTEESFNLVDFSELSFTGVVHGREENGAVIFESLAYEGTGAVTYEKDGVSAAIEITFTQPCFGLYSSEEASAEAYLGSEIRVGSADDTFYIVAADGFENFEVTEIYFLGRSDSHDATDEFDIIYSEDGTYAAISPKTDSMPMGGNYYISLTSGVVSFELIRTDITALTTPAGLSWHAEYRQIYDVDAGIIEVSRERMGAMSFMPGETTQNRFDVEVYSADNSFTPVLETQWLFGDTDYAEHFTVDSFTYADLPSGTYQFRVRALGDGTDYSSSDWSELSEEWTYIRPSQRLKAPDAAAFAWVKQDDGRYFSQWEPTGESAAGYYNIDWYIDDEEGQKQQRGGMFIDADYSINGVFMENLPDDLLQESGNTNIYFRVRVAPSDITQYRISEYSDYSEAFDVNKVTASVNDKLDEIIGDIPTSGGDINTVRQIQDALRNDTEELRTAMAADLEISGGTPSGTLERIGELENAVSGAVDSGVEAADDAPRAIKDIADGITMTGAKLNAGSTDDSSAEKPSVRLVIGEPEEGIVIDEQQHNSVQFSMKLSGAVDRDGDDENGQQLIVPIVIDMPVPEGINPDFLVILHKLSSGRIEQIRPSIYFNEEDDRSHAVFIVSSFSDFALVEYSFGFDTDSLTKYTDSGEFTMAASGSAPGSTVSYESSDPSVASVDPASGRVTIHKAGRTTITAIASGTDVYPEASDSYELTVKKSHSILPDRTHDTGASTKPDDGNGLLFSDVPSGAFYTEAVSWAVRNGITRGTGDGTTFSPDDCCTRAEMAAFLWRAVGQPEPKNADSFSDIPENAYYAKAVAWAVENGITKGTGDGTTFSPDAPCTRAQMVTFLCRLAGGEANGSDVTFADVESSAYYAGAVIWAVENGITKGTGSGLTFSPDDLCTRAQMVTFLYRYFAK